MFEFLTRTKVFETVDVEKKQQLQQAFFDHKIDLVICKKDIHHRSGLDTMKMGEMMVKPKYVYVFWVKKKQNDLAELVIQSLR